MMRRNSRNSDRERMHRAMRLVAFSGAMVVSGGCGIVYCLRGEVGQALACGAIFCLAALAVWGEG